ncbi:CDP-glucose 4,6-dehydratase [Mucilaginibacter mallensis]|uniref:CDP-glucose 4,6-dehydratase n=1 Tax=Mucilaginibacter mallensis TaxID=652787 RepID=A0A1H2AM65_MUCMA|nr:CDP-glucose 4,6-dehydratase [Mucilaginibacter mallensis]SDT46969.1 CDP-glucose 4,6-dehydratase [Mucilaginibacter mallensis]
MFEQLKTIYNGKKVFLTGHTGFKGSWMLKLLNMLGAEVKGYSLAPKTENDLFCLINGDQLSNSIISDLRNREKLISEIVDFEPDFVFHLAAQPLVRLSYEIPSETFEVNAIGTANVLDGIRKLNNTCYAVFITTDKVYHNYEWVYPYRETDRLGGYDPYSASKACTELVIDSYRNSYFNVSKYNDHHKAIAVARAGNVIGGGDWSQDRLIPDIVKFLNAGEDIIIRNPQAVRPWQHVLEPVLGYLLLGTKLVADPVKYMQAYNFGPYTSDTLEVADMVKLAIKAWGGGQYKIMQNANQPHEAGLLKLDITKAETELQWHPKNNASQAVQLTIDWYKAYYDNRDTIDEFTERQITAVLNG